jgi:dihydrofolate synthase/folylpolyglutamate synthase
MAVIEARCRAVGVPLLVEGRELAVETLASDLAGHRLRLRGPGFAYDDVRLALPGLFQPGNAVLAVGAVRAFADRSGLAVPEAAVRAGGAGVRWPGRFQVIAGAAGRPTLVLDGAHNPAGARALAASLGHHFAGRRLALVLGVSADKDRVGILEALAPLASRIYLAPADHPRATPPKELLDQLPPVEADVVLTAGSEEALERALGEPGIDVVCVAGSLFLVADALRWLGARGLVDAV